MKNTTCNCMRCKMCDLSDASDIARQATGILAVCLAIMAGIIFALFAGAAKACESKSVIVHVASWHKSEHRNNENIGLGGACKLSGITYSAGAFLNSFERVAPYAVAAIETKGDFRVGLAAGLAYYPKVITYTGPQIKPIGGITVAYKSAKIIMYPEFSEARDVLGREERNNWAAHLMFEIKF